MSVEQVQNVKNKKKTILILEKRKLFQKFSETYIWNIPIVKAPF